MINSPILATTGVAEVAPVVLTDGLVAHYLLNNNADDSVGAIDGVPTIGLGLDFKGDSVYFGGSDSIEIVGVTSTNFTISGWVYNNNGNSVRFYSDSNIEIFLQDGFNLAAKIWTNQDSTGPYNTVVKTWNFPEGWFHVVVTSAGTFYVNGINQNATITPNTISNDYSGDRIGGLVVNGSDLYTAATWISNVRKYNIVADQNLVTALYEEGYYPKPLPLPTTDGLVAHYPLTGTGEDSQGEGGNESGTEFNGVSFVDESAFKGDKVAIFDGIDDRIDTGHKFTWGNHTISAWIKVSSLTDASAILADVNQSNNSAGTLFYVNTSGNVLGYLFQGTSADTAVSSPSPLNLGEWYHVALVRQKSTFLKLYINGVEVASVSQTNGSDILGSFNAEIGANTNYTGTPARWFDGDISNLRIYNTTLGVEDIETLYAEGSDQTVVPTSTGLVAHYKLNGNATDETGSYNGTEFGSMVYSTEQRGDSVASFDDTFDYITALNGATTTDITTLALWGKNDTENTNVSYLIGQNGTTHGRTRGIIYADGRVSFFSRDSALTYKAIDYTMSNLEQTNYHHYALTQQGSIIKAYVDGVLVGTLDMISSSTFTSTLVFGVIPDDFDFYSLDGKLSSAYSYSRALSDIEIEALYNEVDEPTDGLIAHYPLTIEARANDSWAAYDGTESGTVIYLDDVEFGSVADFNGTADYIDMGVGVSEIPAFKTQQHTISCWVNIDSIGSTQRIISNHQRSAAGGSTLNSGTMLFVWSDGKIGFQYTVLNSELATDSNGNSYNSYGIYATTAAVQPLNTWIYVTAVMDDNSSAIYINGVLDVTVSSVQSLRWDIGGLPKYSLAAAVLDTTPSGFFNGSMKDVRHYNRVLTQQEITDIYNYEKNFRPVDIDDGLVAYYPLANNFLDNYKNQADLVATGTPTFDGNMVSFLSGEFAKSSTHIVTVPPSATFWTDAKTASAIDYVFFSNNHATLYMGFIFIINANSTVTMLQGDGTGTSSSDRKNWVSTTSVDWTVPNFISIVYRGFDDFDVYVNLVKLSFVYESGTASSVAFSDGNILVGVDDGKMGRCRVYDKPLTLERMQIIYNTEKGDFI